MIATKAQAENRLLEIALEFRDVLIDAVEHAKGEIPPTGQSLREKYTPAEAEALVEEIQHLVDFLE